MQIKNKSWIEISKKALFHNINVFRKAVGKKVKIAAVIKANAYGHGLPEMTNLLKGHVDILAVDNIEEALIIREIDKQVSILVLGYIPLSEIYLAIDNEISFVVYNIETLEQIVALKNKKLANVHLKIETGLNRQGVRKDNLKKIVTYIIKNKNNIYLEGISTHFANIEDTLDSSYFKKQLTEFKDALAYVKKLGLKPPMIHTAASAGTLLYPETHFSMVRIGFGMYGWWMSTETRVMLMAQKKNLILKPVMTWKSIIAQIKEIDVGEAVGYGLTWFASRKTKIAIIPIGYSDGYDRKLSNIGRVIVNGKYAPVIGRVAMNMIVIDITDVGNVRLEDEVALLGNMDGLKISADEIAKKIGTINYEVISRINPSLPRIIV